MKVKYYVLARDPEGAFFDAAVKALKADGIDQFHFEIGSKLTLAAKTVTQEVDSVSADIDFPSKQGLLIIKSEIDRSSASYARNEMSV